MPSRYSKVFLKSFYAFYDFQAWQTTVWAYIYNIDDVKYQLSLMWTAVWKSPPENHRSHVGRAFMNYVAAQTRIHVGNSPMLICLVRRHNKGPNPWPNWIKNQVCTYQTDSQRVCAVLWNVRKYDSEIHVFCQCVMKRVAVAQTCQYIGYVSISAPCAQFTCMTKIWVNSFNSDLAQGVVLLPGDPDIRDRIGTYDLKLFTVCRWFSRGFRFPPPVKLAEATAIIFILNHRTYDKLYMTVCRNIAKIWRIYFSTTGPQQRRLTFPCPKSL